MADISDQAPDSQPDDEKRRTLLPRFSAFTPEQASELAQVQVQRVVIFTGGVLTTVITVFSTALGFVTGFAWNTFMQKWLPTVLKLDKNSTDAPLIYALAVTLLAVIFIFVVAFITRRYESLRERIERDSRRP